MVALGLSSGWQLLRAFLLASLAKIQRLVGLELRELVDQILVVVRLVPLLFVMLTAPF